MAAHKKYDYVQICSERGLEYLYEENPNIFVKDNLGFTHKMTRTNLAQGSSVGFKSVLGCKTEYFKAVFNEKFGDQSHLFSFDRFNYQKSLNYTEVKCLKHGVYRTKPNWLLNRGHHCESCAEETRNLRGRHSLSDFVDLARLKHGDKYDYSFVDYGGCRERVKVVCPEHGVFEQVPYYHLAGKGCPDCGKLLGGFGRSDYIAACPDGSYIYLMKLESKSEMFYKVGISKNPAIRARGISNESGYDVNILSSKFLSNAALVFDLEKELFRLFKDFSYRPQLSFAGETECFSYINSCEFDELLGVVND